MLFLLFLLHGFYIHVGHEFLFVTETMETGIMILRLRCAQAI